MALKNKLERLSFESIFHKAGDYHSVTLDVISQNIFGVNLISFCVSWTILLMQIILALALKFCNSN